jgi:hypothetical protein
MAPMSISAQIKALFVFIAFMAFIALKESMDGVVALPRDERA